MPVELKGQQLRIRLINPKLFSKFRVHDVGEKGKLQRVAGYSKKIGWKTQAIRLNLKTYRNMDDAVNELIDLYDRGVITKKQYDRARILVARWFSK